MASTSLRRSARSLPARELDPETLKQLHTRLVDERQQLRSDGAPAEELERNRLAIVHCQWELSRALIERYLPPTATPSAA
jgi:ornithine cyclodeaminase/alanine dehydrogenase-like protein (mu-crystallin family)